MPETVIPTLHFDGKASTTGSFDPLPLGFTVLHELIFSAVRVTIAGLAEERVHKTMINIDVHNGGRVNSVSVDVPDNKPTTAGAFSQLSRLSPGTGYEVDLSSSNFASSGEGENVSITIELLEFDSTVAEVTRDVLRDAEAESDVNAIAFGISEASFAHFMTHPSTQPEFNVGAGGRLKLKLAVERIEFPGWPFVHIDVSAKIFLIFGRLSLTFFLYDEGVVFPRTVAVVQTDLQVDCQPAMVTTTEDMLQLQVLGVKMNGSLMENILDDTIKGILAGFPSKEDFTEAYNGYLAQITARTGDFGFILPAYVATRSMPDHWQHVIGMKLDFMHFSYRTVEVHGLPISYLFLVFSVQSLGLPPPCYCETEQLSLLESDAYVAAIHSPPNQRRQKMSPGDYTDYSHILAAAQVASFGLSQRSFQEITKQYASIGLEQSISSRGKGTVYSTLRFWLTTRLKEAEILEDGVKVVIDCTGEGSAKTAVRDKCGDDILSASARLRIRIEDSSIEWTLNMYENRITVSEPDEGESATPLELTIEALPVATVGRPVVDFETPFDPPPPMDQIDDWVITKIVQLARPSLNKLVEHALKIQLIRTIENNGGIRFRFVRDKCFTGEAAVVLGQLFESRWR